MVIRIHQRALIWGRRTVMKMNKNLRQLQDASLDQRICQGIKTIEASFPSLLIVYY